MSPDRSWVVDMRRFAAQVVECLDGVTADGFLTDIKTQGAVLHYVTVLGEAARRVSPGFRGAYPAIDWPGIVSLRNRIVHEYDDYDLDTVWAIATTDVPRLIADLDALIPDLTNGEEA